MTAKEYLIKEYGENHIRTVVDFSDLDSLFTLIDEYKNTELLKHSKINMYNESDMRHVHESFDKSESLEIQLIVNNKPYLVMKTFKVK